GAGTAVRLLHTGHADACARAAPREPDAERPGDPRDYLGQPLPLHGIPGDRRGCPPRRVPRRCIHHSLAFREEMVMATTERQWIGKDVPRLEDPKLLAGRATYTDDVKLPGMLHAAVLRSPHPHARIKRVDTSQARALPGVFAVVTGEDAKELTGPLPAFCAEPVLH